MFKPFFESLKLLQRSDFYHKYLTTIAGQFVEGHYVLAPVETALQRVRDREAETGRRVPESIVREKHKAVAEILPRVVPLFDMICVYDNSGDKLFLLATGGNGKVLTATPGNEALLESYLGKRT